MAVEAARPARISFTAMGQREWLQVVMTSTPSVCLVTVIATPLFWLRATGSARSAHVSGVVRNAGWSTMASRGGVAAVRGSLEF